MSRFLTQSELARHLVEKTKVSEETAKAFSTVFFNLVKKGLKESDRFPVHNFGTFKKTWIEEADGINPSNGEEIKIPAHWRIKFIPCASVAKRLNKRFAGLKPRPYIEPKVGPDGLYAKAEHYNSLQELEKPRLGLLRVADKIHSELPTVVMESEDEELEENEIPEEEMFRAEEEVKTEKTENPSASENTSEKQIEAADIPETEKASEEKTVSENEEDKKSKIIPSVTQEEIELPEQIENSVLNQDEDDADDDSDEGEEEKTHGKAGKIAAVAGLSAVFLILAGALLVKNCSGKGRKKAPENDRKKPETEVEQTEESLDLSEENTASDEAMEIEAEALFESYTVPSGKNYHTIAEEKLGNRHLWPLLYSANKTKSYDPDFIPSYRTINVPENADKYSSSQLAAAFLDAYNGYLLMIEKQPESPKNEERRNRAIRVIVSAELVSPGFIDANAGRILPEYRTMAKNIVSHQYKR